MEEIFKEILIGLYITFKLFTLPQIIFPALLVFLFWIIYGAIEAIVVKKNPKHKPFLFL